MASTSTQFESMSPGRSSFQAGTPLENATPREIIAPDHQLPDHTTVHGSSIGDLARAYTQIAGQAFDVARRSVVCAWYRARAGTARTYARTTRATQDMAVRTRDQAVTLQREHPVRLLGMVAGAAFLAGVATRIWRSRSV